MAAAAAPAADDDARPCPWCGRWAMKDPACNWVCCGEFNDAEMGVRGFRVGMGCGRQWCFRCGRPLCGAPRFDATTGAAAGGVSSNHTATCCEASDPSGAVVFCPGGHNSHRPPAAAPRDGGAADAKDATPPTTTTSVAATPAAGSTESKDDETPTAAAPLGGGGDVSSPSDIEAAARHRLSAACAALEAHLPAPT